MIQKLKNTLNVEQEVIFVTVALYMLICSVILTIHYIWMANEREVTDNLLPPVLELKPDIAPEPPAVVEEKPEDAKLEPAAAEEPSPQPRKPSKKAKQ